MKFFKFVSFFMVLLCFFNIHVTAHPGRTDSAGGHKDNINGGYHYHHGQPEHRHTNGICPYEIERDVFPSDADDEERGSLRDIVCVAFGVLALDIANRICCKIKEKRKPKNIDKK